MKKIYFLLSFFFTVLLSAQAILTAVETPAGFGIIKIIYNDAANSWAFYNPESSNTIWLHTWLTTADSSANSAYIDDWMNSTEKLTWMLAQMHL